MSELCITQFTRKRVGNNILSYLVKPCSCCGGIGHVHDDIFVITRLREEMLDRFVEGYNTIVVDLNIHIMKRIVSEGLFSVEAKARWKDKNIYFIPHKTYKEDYFTVRGEHSPCPPLPENAYSLHETSIPCTK
jgi:Ribonuclease G/E